MNETNKMMNIIHDNCKKEKAIRQIQKEIKNKKEKQAKRKEMICLLVAMVVVLVLLGIYTNKQVKDCMDDGYSETFCKYAGE